MRRGKKRKPAKQKIRNQADKALQNYIKAKHQGELCWLCGNRPMTVGHHFVYKSQSNATRYYLPNIIPLCQNCHCLIHSQPSLTNARISLKLGQEWLVDLEEVKRGGQKFTKEWVETELKILQDLTTALKEA